METSLCMHSRIVAIETSNRGLLAEGRGIQHPFTKFVKHCRPARPKHPMGVGRQSARSKVTITSAGLPENTEVVIVGAGEPSLLI